MNKINSNDISFVDAQLDMRNSYLAGGPGVFVSSIMWIVAGLTAIYFSKQISIIVFFFGGMLIHPIGILISKLFKRTGKHQKNNPLSKTALESTAILFIGLFIAYTIFQIQPDWFFPIMLLIIGVRYLIFQSLYGVKFYWPLGLCLIITGIVCLISNQPFYISGITGGSLELIFAILIIRIETRSHKSELQKYS